MSITDELREFASHCAGGMGGDSLRHIADRIDAEHESACAEAYGNGVMSVPIALDESAWVELPKDANGVPIRVGDVLTDGEYTFRVDELTAFGDGSWSIRNEDGNAWAACDVTHHHAPTVEDVLLEACNAYHSLLIEGMSDVAHDMPAPSEIIAEYSAKLRLANDGEEQ